MHQMNKSTCKYQLVAIYNEQFVRLTYHWHMGKRRITNLFMQYMP